MQTMTPTSVRLYYYDATPTLTGQDEVHLASRKDAAVQLVTRLPPVRRMAMDEAEVQKGDSTTYEAILPPDLVGPPHIRSRYEGITIKVEEAEEAPRGKRKREELPPFEHWYSPAARARGVGLTIDARPVELLVAATPDPVVSVGKVSTNAREGAILRCIASPWRHLGLGVSNPEPQRRANSPILHSFVDGSTRTTSPFTYPVAIKSLRPGRRGAWIVPLERPPIPSPSVSSGTWSCSISPSTQSASTLRQQSKDERGLMGPRQIEWTDERLKALWYLLSQLHRSGRMGRLEAACVFASPTPKDRNSSKVQALVLGKGRGAGIAGAEDEGRGDHIRIYADAGAALALRALLAVVSVTGVRTQRGESLGEVEVEDPKRFLGDVGLVWVDEAGTGVLVA